VTSTVTRPKARRRVADTRHDRGVIDTSVVIDLESITPDQLPRKVAVSAITMAQLAAGPHAATSAPERARRQDRLQRAEAAFDPLPFDVDAARAYGRIYAAILGVGRKARGPRAVDLLLAAVACAQSLPLYTRNPDDFRGLETILDIIEV
jgi:predicted nucleic acid-binding protein